MFSLPRLATRTTIQGTTMKIFSRATLLNCGPFPRRAGLLALNTTSRVAYTNQKKKGESYAMINRQAPYWEADSVVDGAFRKLTLDDYEKKYLVMMFYPLDFTFVCPTELISCSDRIGEFKALNAEVVGISCDSKYSHLEWLKVPRQKGGIENLRIPLIADFKKEISRTYGVLCEEEGYPFRGTVIVDDDGLVRLHHINDTQIGRSIDETLRLIQAIQFNKKHGEVCPANWKVGDATIKPEPEESQRYFSSVKE